MSARPFSVLAEAVRARVAACIAAEARGALGLFRADAAAARMGGKTPLFGGLMLGFELAEPHGPDWWRLTPAGLDAVEAARPALAVARDGADATRDATRAPGKRT